MGAPLNPVPQVLRIFLEGFIDNDDVYKWGNVLAFHYTGGPPSAATLNDMAARTLTLWAAHMASLCPSPTSLRSVTITDLTSSASAEGGAVDTVPGTRGDDSIPANAAVLVNYGTMSHRYKGGHPRNYLYVGGNADLEGAGHWANLFVAEVQAHWQSFLQNHIGITTGGSTVDTFGSIRYRGKFLPNSGPPHYYLDTPIFQPIDWANATAQKEIASQRRRVGRRKA